MKPKKEADDIFVTKIEQASIRVVLVGREPLIENRMAEKARQQLLMPKGKKSSAEKQSSMKHDVLDEFQKSAYLDSDNKAPTYIVFPASAPKRALASAALDMPGAKKAQIGRLTWVPGERVPVYGRPQMLMSVVRSADMNRTPDIRTRCIIPEWAIPLEIQFASPILNPTIIINLLVAAGMYVGLGDWRNEKGASNKGQFDVLSVEQAAKDARVIAIMKQGRAVQIEGMEKHESYDDETAELFSWYEAELKVRGKQKVA